MMIMEKHQGDIIMVIGQALILLSEKSMYLTCLTDKIKKSIIYSQI